MTDTIQSDSDLLETTGLADRYDPADIPDSLLSVLRQLIAHTPVTDPLEAPSLQVVSDGETITLHWSPGTASFDGTAATLLLWMQVHCDDVVITDIALGRSSTTNEPTVWLALRDRDTVARLSATV